jgi:uncharacterized protein YkwD
VTLTRGGLTTSRHRASPIEGTPGRSRRPYGAPVSGGAAAAPARNALVALCATFVAACALVSTADGGGRSAAALLAPAGACESANDPRASAAAQIRAVACLINHARAKERRGQLADSALLTRAAALKGRQVASCGDFSHTPCGTDFAATFRRAGYRYASVGENLYAGPWGRVTARDVVLAWLRSPGHRANMLSPGFRQVGAAPVRANSLLGNSASVVWTATFGTPR